MSEDDHQHEEQSDPALDETIKTEGYDPEAQTIIAGQSVTLRDDASDDGTQHTLLDATLPMAEGAAASGMGVYGIKPSNKEQRFDIYGELNRGGMGAILESRDLNLRRDVAMKVILSEKASEREVRRFVEEAQITGQLEHPSIVPVHELGVDAQGKIFYTMKMVHGDTLKDILKKIAQGDAETIKKYSLSKLLDIYNRICDALSFAHSKGIIHRDLKPENIMIGDFGEVQVMDWGLAKILGSDEDVETNSGTGSVETLRSDKLDQTMDGQILGTPQFMAPEQARGDIADLCPRTDIYALGAILYQMLTLRPPVSGKSVQALLHKVVEGEITPPTEYNSSSISRSKQEAQDMKKETRRFEKDREIVLKHCPNSIIPHSLSAVCMRAMHKDIDQRYQDVAALQKDIRSYLDGFATEAEQASSWRQIILLIRRHRSEFAIVAGGLIAVIILVSFFVINLQESELAARNAMEHAQSEHARAQSEALRAVESERLAREGRQLAEEKTRAAQLAEQEAKYSYYRMAINEVGRLLDAGYMQKALSVIDKTEEQFRNWEYFYLHNRIHKDEYFEFVKPRAAPWFYTSAMSLSPDARYLATASWAKTANLSLWDLSTGEHLCTNTIGYLLGVRKRAMAFDISYAPNGKYIAIASGHGDILVSGANLLDLHLHIEKAHENSVCCVRFSPDGTMIASGSYDHTVKLWNAQTGALITSIEAHTDRVYGVNFSADGRYLLSAGADDLIHIWDVQNYTKTQTLKGHDSDVRMACFSPDGTQVASAGWDKMVKIWNTADGALVHNFHDHTERVEFVSYSSDGKYLVSCGGDAVIRVWDPKAGTLLMKKIGNTSNVVSALFMNDNKNLISSGTSNTLKIWDLKPHVSERVLDCEQGSAYVRAVMDMSTDGAETASVYKKKEINIHDTTSGQLKYTIPLQGIAPVRAIKYVKDGLILAVGRANGEIEIWNMPDKKIITVLKADKSSAKFLDVSQDRQYLIATYDKDGFLLWDTQSWTIKKDWGCDHGATNEVRFINAENDICVYYRKKWRTLVQNALSAEVKFEMEAHGDIINEYVFSPNGVYAVGIISQNLMGVWNGRTGKFLKSFEGRGLNYFFTPDSKRLILANAGKHVSIWDTQTWEKLLTLRGHERPVNGIYMSTDGVTLAAHSAVGQIRIYRAPQSHAQNVDPLVSTLMKNARPQSERKQHAGIVTYSGYQAYNFYNGSGVPRNYQKALELFREQCNTEVYRPGLDYAAMRVWLCYMHLKQGEQAMAELRAYVDKFKPKGWSRSILDFMLGDLSAEALLQRAQVKDEQLRREQLCEAHYYIGSQKRFENNVQAAREHFENCLATNVKEFTEYMSAQIELKELE